MFPFLLGVASSHTDFAQTTRLYYFWGSVREKNFKGMFGNQSPGTSPALTYPVVPMTDTYGMSIQDLALSRSMYAWVYVCRTVASLYKTKILAARHSIEHHYYNDYVL